MKFLEVEKLSKLTEFLSAKPVGASVLDGRVEAYSCKAAGVDKKLSKQLQKQYEAELATSPNTSTMPSPLGDLTDVATRKLLINLISTLNASFPDYDFSNVKGDNFQRVTATTAITSINSSLAEVIELQGVGFVEELWGAINEVIKIHEADVYTYIPDLEDDPLSSHALWSFNYFFVNGTEKKILYFTCMARSKRSAATDDDDVELSDDDDGADSDRDSDGRKVEAEDADTEGMFDWDMD